MDWGYWALVASSILVQTLRLVLITAVSRYTPGRPGKLTDSSSLIKFGGFLTLSSIVTFASTNVDILLVGRWWGVEDLGLYSRAVFLMTLPASMIWNSLGGVLLPALSGLAHDPPRMEHAYRKVVNAAAFVGFPVAIGLALTSS